MVEEEAIAIADPSPDLVALWARVGNGITWLTEHDPTGAFHLWFKSGLTPTSRMPRQATERIEDWRSYYRQRRIWEELWKAMVKLETVELRRQERGT